MSRMLHIGLRAMQVILAIANLGLSGYIVDWYANGTRTTSPAIFNFLVAAPIFSMVSIAYLELTPRFAPRATNPYVSMAVEAINAIFYFAGFIAVAVFLSALVFCNGNVCDAAKADAVITAVLFVTWATTLGLLVKDLFKGGLRKPTSTV